jgi:hypothetical protein
MTVDEAQGAGAGGGAQVGGAVVGVFVPSYQNWPGRGKVNRVTLGALRTSV